MPVKLSL